MVLSLLVLAFLLLRSSFESEGRSPLNVQQLLSADTRPSKQIRKIDEEGVYTPFETIVVLQRARTDLHPAYETAHHLLVSSYSRFLTPLPMDSYHVTLSGVVDRSKTDDVDEYNSLITANHGRLERLVYVMGRLVVDGAPLTFALLDVVATGTGVILHLRPKRSEDGERVEWLAALANRTLGLLYKRQARWHLTLAYKVPPIKKIDENELTAASAELRKLFAGVDVVVRTPTLCVSLNVAICHDLH